MYLATRVLDNYHDLVFGVAGDMWFYERFIESDLDYDPAVLRTVHAECISTHYASVGDNYSCSGNFLEISGMENFRKFPEISNLIFSFPDWLLEIHFTYY